MLIKIICIVALLEFSLSDNEAPTLPMKKDSKYGDDVCSYTKNSHKYVKHCKKGQYCDNLLIDTLESPSIDSFFEETKIEICQDLPNITSLYTLGETSCKNDFECESSYKCIGNVCSIKCDDGYFYSKYANDCKDISDKGTDGFCVEITKRKGQTDIYKYSPPKPNKICGKLTFADDPNDNKKGIYYVNKKEYVYQGEVEDGEYVDHRMQKLCKSGFALYFFKDGKTEDPKDENAVGNNEMYLRCVTPISISKSKDNKWFINYKLNENGETFRYNVEKLRNLIIDPTESMYNEIKAYCTENIAKYIKLASEKYREYYTNMSEEERKTCEYLDTSNKYTCENNNLIRSWYFYMNPEKYSAYNDRKKIRKVVDYLIQKKYPCYSLSQFISIKFIYLLFLLLF